MKRGIIFFAALLFFFLLIISCNNKSDKSSIHPNGYRVIKNIPQHKNGRLDYPYKMAKRLTEESGLSKIEDGFDSIFLRLWYVYSGAIQVADFYKKRNRWTGEFHTIQQDIDTVKYVLKFGNIKSSKIYPKSGWGFFINKILSLGIMNLPDDSELQGYDIHINDASFVVVEIATTTNYRIYSYSMPAEFPEIKEAKAMEDIMKIIEEEFGIKRLSNF